MVVDFAELLRFAALAVADAIRFAEFPLDLLLFVLDALFFEPMLFVVDLPRFAAAAFPDGFLLAAILISGAEITTLKCGRVVIKSS